MLRSERADNPQDTQRDVLHGFQAEVWTALPGIVVSVNLPKMTCVIQPAIQGLFRKKDGTKETVTMPLCLDVPIQFPGGGGYTLTFPLVAEDEGIIIFSSRCIDGWWQSGGVQPQAELRMHDLSDGMFIPGIRSQPRVLSGIPTDAVQLMADDGSAYCRISEAQLTLKHPTKVLVDSPDAEFSGNVKIDGEITGGGSQAVRLADGSASTKLKGT